MEINFYKKEAQRLINHFSKEVMTAERLNLVWKETKDLTDKQFIGLVDVLIGEYSIRFVPTLSVIREQAHLLRKKEKEQEMYLASKNLKINEAIRHESGNFNLRQHVEENPDQYAHNSLIQAILKTKSQNPAEKKKSADEQRKEFLEKFGGKKTP